MLFRSGFYASLVNINAYHQPGVEAGKKAAAAILEIQKKVLSLLQSSSSPLDLVSIAQKINAEEDIETVYLILRHLEANNRGVKLIGERSQIANLQVTFEQV